MKVLDCEDRGVWFYLRLGAHLCFISCLLCLIAACDRPRVVAEIGSFTLNERDVAYRNRLIQLEYPGEARDLGLKQLVEAYVYAEILRVHGVTIDEKGLEREEERIRTRTQIPE